MKKKRQNMILKLIKSNAVETQEELLELLKNEGFDTTQATVSRDIRDLKLKKIAAENGRQKYAVSENETKSKDVIDDNSESFNKVLQAGIISMETAENIIVVKTVSGMAMAVGAAIDNARITGMLGCIAGDDTIFIVVKNSSMADEVMKNIEKVAYRN